MGHLQSSNFKERFNDCCPNYKLPEIWIKHKYTKTKKHIVEFYDYLIATPCGDGILMFDLFNNYVYLDDTPCGVKE